uniref:hypothetical protein n=1 Tax=Jatropha curcas TaxID=180498 RepID=UPI0027AB5EAA|nr:hypothetical protein QLP06_mgp084 [Jatropha curcas]WFG81155.1 hypothetical protein [Jatropha curcas]
MRQMSEIPGFEFSVYCALEEIETGITSLKARTCNQSSPLSSKRERRGIGCSLFFLIKKRNHNCRSEFDTIPENLGLGLPGNGFIPFLFKRCHVEKQHKKPLQRIRQHFEVFFFFHACIIQHSSSS